MSDKYWDRGLTWIEGCTPVSEGCEHCWSAALEHRFHRTDKTEGVLVTNANGSFNGKVFIREDRLDIPLRAKKATTFSVWNDLFHEGVPALFVQSAYTVMLQAKQHTFLVLTKRAKIMARVIKINAPNIWHGVTAENQQRADERIPYLLQVPGKRFVSFEPLLSDIKIPHLIGGDDKEGTRYANIDWIIVGCETGNPHRPCKLEWIESIVQQCKDAGVPCFVKAININGKVIRDIEKFPEYLQIRQIPW